MKIILRVAAALLFATPLLAQTRVDATPIAPVTLSDLPPIDENAAEPRHEIRHERRAPLEVWLSTPLIGEDAVPVVTPTIAPPRIAASFKANASGAFAPSDASGAVSKDHVVAMTNAGLLVQTRAGAVLKSASLFTFLGEGISGSGVYYDPRIAYDSAADRWIAIGINDRATSTTMMIAVTQTGDPLGTWSRYRLALGQPGIDFSRLALTRDTILVGTQFPDTGICYIASIKKSDLYSAAGSIPTKQYQFAMYDIAPVDAPDSADEYVVHNNFGSRLRVKRLEEPDSAWRTIEPPVPWSRDTIPAPQLGTANKLDTGLLYPIENAVLRNGVLYVVHTGGRTASAIVWWKVDPVTGARLDAGTIEDPTGETYYAYPSIAVNRAGVMVIGFCAFSAKTYPSAVYAYRDALGRISTIGALKSGEGPFRWSDRWGDYTATVTDPLDDNAFWTTQIIALDDAWQTWWARLQVDPLATKRHSARH